MKARACAFKCVSEHPSVIFHHFQYVAANRPNVTYQESLPEGNVDVVRSDRAFSGQIKPHQQLCTAKDHNDNLGGKRGRMD